jgi:hypothetical protein
VIADRGLAWSDLCAASSSGKHEVAVYQYDDDGVPLFVVVRLWPKGFYQRRPHEEKPPGRRPMDGICRVIYRLR